MIPDSSFVPAKGGLGGRKEHVPLMFGDDKKVKDKILNFNHAVAFLHNSEIRVLLSLLTVWLWPSRKVYLGSSSMPITDKESSGNGILMRKGGVV